MASALLGMFSLFEAHFRALFEEPGQGGALAPLIAAWALGAVLGMRHAFEPDHLAAVATFVGEKRGLGASWLGAAWGLGHTLALVAVGGALVALRLEMPASIEATLELLVAFTLMGLGGLGLARASGWRRAQEDHAHVSLWHRGRRPLTIGLIHGLAGSGALTVLVMARMPSVSAALVFMALFGLGSAATMALVTGLVGRSLEGAQRGARLQRGLPFVTATVSLAVGVVWGVESLRALLA
jgi:nickel/cobalt exporter